MDNTLHRRTVLRAGVGLALAAGVTPAFAGIAHADPARDRLAQVRPGPVSANGWPIERAPDAGGSVWTREIEGTGLLVATAIGDARTVLTHVIRRYHYEIATLKPGEVIGFRPYDRLPRGYQTNHASGTAIDIRPNAFPEGTRGGFLQSELTVIHSILDDSHGVLSWAGDRSDEAHFHIAVGPDDPRLPALAAELRHYRY